MKKLLCTALFTAMFITSTNLTVPAEALIDVSSNIGTDGMIEIKCSDDIFTDNEFVLISHGKFIKLNVLEETEDSITVVPDRELAENSDYTLRDSLGKVNYSFTTLSQLSDAEITMKSYTGINIDSDINLYSDLELDGVSQDTVKLYSHDDNEECDVAVSYSDKCITISPDDDLKKGVKYIVKLKDITDEEGNILKDSVVFNTQIPDKIDIHPYINASEPHKFVEKGSWSYSGVKGYNNTQTKYSTGGTSVSYIPVLNDYNYKVSVYLLYHTSDRYTQAKFEINHEDGKDNVVVPFDRTLAKSHWKEIGVFNFAQGNDGYVKQLADNADYTLYARVGHVRFEPVEDTSKPTAEITYDGALKVEFSKPMSSNVLYAKLNGTDTKLVSNDNKNYILVSELDNDTEYSVTLDNMSSYDGYMLDETSYSFTTVKTVKMPVLFTEDTDKIVYETYIAGENDAYIFAYSFDGDTVIESSESSKAADGVFKVELADALKENSSAIILKNIDDYKPYSSLETVSEITADAQYKNQTLSVNVQSQNFTEGEEIVMAVCDKDGKLVYFKTAKMEADGSNTININIPDSLDGGDYLIYVNTETANKKAETSFYNINSFTIQRAIKALYGLKNNEDVEDAITLYYRELGLLESDINNYNKIDTYSVNEQFINKTLSGDEIKELFRKAVALEAVNQLGGYVDLLAEYEDVFDIDFTVYETLDSKENINSLFKNYVPFEKAENVKSAFDKAVILQLVNESSWGSLETIFTDNEELLEIDLADYNELSESKQNTALKKVKEKTYSKISDFVSAFNNAVSSAKSSGTTSSGGGSTGGRGGSTSGSSVIIANSNIIKNENNNDSTTDKANTSNNVNNTPMEYGFVDIDEIEWAKESIEALFAKGIVDGYEDATFRGNDLLTREAFVKMIVLAFDLKQVGERISYTDLPSSHWCSNYVSIASSNGIINGVSDNEFGVGRPLTRQDMATILYRTVKHLNVELSSDNYEINFIDAVDISEYAVEGISKLQLAGIINGVSENEYAPRSNTTRAMAAKVIYETLKLI